MIFSVIIIVIVLGVAYMHYLQGAFTAAISAACALAATLVAFGYYENLVGMASQNGMADYVGGASMILLFVVTYLVLRVAADSLVPGNIQLQLYVEKAGAAAFGLLAAILGAGTFATAVQMMPVGVAVGGYTRYPVGDRDVVLPTAFTGRTRSDDTAITNEVVKNEFAPEDRSSLLLPADTLTQSLVRTASDGAFSGGQSFAKIHPDLPTEAFGVRVGGEGSGKKVILNNAKTSNASLGGLFVAKGPLKGFDTEAPELRPQKASLTYKASANEVPVIARVFFEPAASDKDGYVRLTPAAARLVINDQTFYPIGSMETATIIGLSRIDDGLFVPVQSGSRGVDLVYLLPKAIADSLAKPAGDDAVRFLELKLFGRIDLATKVTEPYKPSSEAKVARKPASPLGLEIHPQPKSAS